MAEPIPPSPDSPSGGPGGGSSSPEVSPAAPPARRIGLVSRRQALIGGAALLALGAAGGAGVVAILGTEHPAGNGKAVSTTPGALGPGPIPSEPGALASPDGSPGDEAIEPGPATGPARVARENQLPGSRRWELPLTGTGDAEGYASDVSVAPGDRLEIRIRSSAPTVTVTAYRLGCYGNLGGRPVARWKNVRVAAQPAPTTDPVTGMVRAAWTPAITVEVPATWVSGLYAAVLEPAGGTPQYVTFVVREATPIAPILLLSAASTHQAYNAWGGKSLYPDASTGAVTVRGDAGAVAASWDRPYDTHRGAGLVLRWEYPFVRWLEGRAYDVAYAADLDLERSPSIVADRELLVFVGHPEYWSVTMRHTLEGAIAAGTNVAFFSANEMLWRTRFEALAGGRYRSVTCYRSAALDPLAATQPQQATTQWREPPSPDPEAAVIGQMAGHIVLAPGDFVCSAPGHWLYAGTGMAAGDSIARLVGQEYDGFWPQYAPPDTEVVSTSPVTSNVTRHSSVYGPVQSNDPTVATANATVYTAASGATVFAAGTIQWSWGLSDWGSPEYQGYHTPLDPRVGIMTANVLDRLGG